MSLQSAARPGPHHPACSICPEAAIAARRGWSRDGGIQLLERGLVGARGDAGDRRLGERAARAEDEPELVDGDVLVPAGEVAPQHVDEAREHGRAQQRPLLRQRVGDAHGLPAVVVGRQPQLVGEIVGDEGVAEHLGEARPGEGVGDDAARLLRRA